MNYFESYTKQQLGKVNFLPSDEEMTERGIIFQKVIQNPGDAMYTGYRTIHWVINQVFIRFILLTI